jgi:protein-disulfide isomerase
LSKKPPSTPQTRRQRRAAERQGRYDVARDQRRERVAATTSATSSLASTRNLTIGALVVGAILVAVIAFNQLSGRGSTDTFVDPGLEYPAAIRDANALGTTSAPVVMEVWGDFQCPICARNALDVEPALVNQYVLANQLRIVHHEIDILGRGGDESRIPATGAYCAIGQDKYWDYAHWIYANQQGENQGGFRRERVIAIAGAAGLDEAAFTTCLDSQAAADAFAAAQAQGDQLGINQTPTMFLNGTQYVGLKSPTDWATLIDAELAKAGASPAASGGSPATSPAPSASAAP